MRIPLPDPSGISAPASYQFSAPRAVPMQDAAGQQLQQLGAVTQHLGLSVMDTSQDKQHEYDMTRVKQAYTALDGAVGQQEDDYRHKIGQDALGGSRKVAADAMEKTRDHLAQQLDSNHQRELFAQFSTDRLQTARRQLDDHEFRQLQAFTAGQAKALSDTKAASIGKDYLAIPQEPQRAPGAPWTPEEQKAFAEGAGKALSGQSSAVPPAPAVPAARTTFDQNWQTAVSQAKVYAARSGLPPAAQDELVLARTSEMHENVVKALIASQQPDRARQYLEQADKKQIDGQTFVKLEDLVRRGTVQERARSLANEATAPQPLRVPAGQEPKDWAGYAQAQEAQIQQQYADSIDRFRRDTSISPEVAKEAVDNIRQMRFDHDKGRRDRGQQLLQQGEKWLDDNPTKGTQDMPMEMRQEGAALSYGESSLSVAEHWRQYVNGGRQYETDNAFFQRWMAKPMSDPELRHTDPQEFILEHRSDLAPHDMARVVGRIQMAQHRAPQNEWEKQRDEEAIKVGAEQAGILILSAPHLPATQTAYASWRLAALSAKATNPDQETPDIVKQMVGTQLKLATGKNFYGGSPADQQGATVTTGTGRTIPLADVVDENGKPMVETIRRAIAIDNEQRARMGLPPVDNTPEEAVRQWEAGQQALQAQQVQEFRSTLGSAAIATTAAGASDYVSLPDAMRVTGLTKRELDQGMPDGRGGLFRDAQGTIQYGYSVNDLARVQAQQKRRK